MKKILFLCCLLILTKANAQELVEPSFSISGLDITYQYTSGRSYHVKFEQVGISYQYLTGSKPEVWWGPFPYKSFEVEANVFYASWFEKGYGDHVTLLINLNNHLLYGSALIASKELHFHGAQIVKQNR